MRVLEAHIETLKAENEILRRRLAAAETLAAQETAKADGAIAELSALTRIRARGRQQSPRASSSIGQGRPLGRGPPARLVG